MISSSYQCEGQMSLFDLGIWSGKMCPEPLRAEKLKEQISKQSCTKSAKSQTRTQFLCLSLKKDGLTQDFSWETDTALLGEYMTHNIGEYPNEERESHLSQILVEDSPEKYCLSQRACQGILNRAQKRGKELPPILREALESVVTQPCKSEEGNRGGAKEP